MISDIYIPNTFKDQYVINGAPDKISGINRVNIFIGPNNSGKSRFLRGLFAEELRYENKDISFEDIATLAGEIRKQVSEKLKTSEFEDVAGPGTRSILSQITEIESHAKQAILPHNFSLFQELNTYIENLSNFKFSSGNHKLSLIRVSIDTNTLSFQLRDIGNQYKDQLTVPPDSPPSYNKIYIPILRGLRPLHNISHDKKTSHDVNYDSYLERTIRDYFPSFKDKKTEQSNIFTGLSLYEDTTTLLLGQLEERKKVKAFEEFLSTNFFHGQPLALTPNRSDDCLYLTLGEDDRAIYELGDGIQNLIILLYPLFFNKDKSLLVFIEEPELSLHPGLQRLFIDTIMKPEFSSMQFFLTTHSNHFLDMILDHSQISIYNFKKGLDKKKAIYEITNTNNEDINLLDSIGVRNSAVFLSNCTIWVEGITDRLYLNKYLEVYQKSILGEKHEKDRLKEDLHYSFVEYGGANIVHYSFDDNSNWEKIKASRLSTKIMVIVDEDGTSVKKESKKASRLTELQEHLKDNLIILPCREIENTLSEKTIKDTISSLEKNQQLNLTKIKEKSYLQKQLGAFIRDNVEGLGRKYAADSGTISNKIQFCKEAISHINSIDDLSNSAKEIIERIWTFIEKSNS